MPELELDPLEEEHAPAAPEEEGELGEESTQDDAMRSVPSTMLAEWGYNRETEQLEVVYNNGRQASYPCSPELWEEAKNAGSPGHFMHENFL